MTKRDILSDADVEVLFETNSISEIKQFNIDLEKDVDKKREELRTTVGERYRDLMEAAETITHMKTTSIDVVSAFKDIAATTSKYETYSSISNIKYQQNVNEENSLPVLFVFLFRIARRDTNSRNECYKVFS